MNKSSLYFRGGFDVLHEDHKKFILSGVKLFEEKYGDLQGVIVELRSDFDLSTTKGTCRPFFSYDWRKEDISEFLLGLGVKYKVIGPTNFFSKFKQRKDMVVGMSSEYPSIINEMEDYGFPVIPINPINVVHTSTLETSLFELQKKSNCNLRKVGTLLIRKGEIITGGYSGAGNCNCCSKYIAYQNGGELCRQVACDYPHAEEVALAEAKKGDDLITTCSPCMLCAELIAEKGIRRVVYLEEYHNNNPVIYLIEKGIRIRKAGCK